MKVSEITNRNDAELQSLIDDSRRELMQAGIDVRTKEVKDVKAQARLKKTIAQALTVQRQRQLSPTEDKS